MKSEGVLGIPNVMLLNAARLIPLSCRQVSPAQDGGRRLTKVEKKTPSSICFVATSCGSTVEGTSSSSIVIMSVAFSPSGAIGAVALYWTVDV